jgi:hypothetical protein
MIPVILFVKNKYRVSHTAITVAISFLITVSKTNAQLFGIALWLAWVLVFNIASIVILRKTKGRLDLFQNKPVLFGIYAPFSFVLIAVCIILSFQLIQL